MRRDIYVMAMLTLALLVEPVVGAYTFISPADQSSYTKGATIAFVGNGGGSPGSAYVVEFRKESGTVEQLKSGTCGQMNMWSGDLVPPGPSNLWEVDQAGDHYHTIVVIPGFGDGDSHRVKIVNSN